MAMSALTNLPAPDDAPPPHTPGLSDDDDIRRGEHHPDLPAPAPLGSLRSSNGELGETLDGRRGGEPFTRTRGDQVLDFIDHAFWVFHPRRRRDPRQDPVWGDFIRRHGDLPPITPDGPPPPVLRLPRLRPCRKSLGGCGAGVGQHCTTADGKITTRVHKARQT
jgi:hypothetical protein